MRWPKKAPVVPRTDTTSTARAGVVFQWLGDFVVRWPWVVIGCWIALAVVLPLVVPSLTGVIQKQPVTPVPADAPAIVANRQITEAFPASGSDNMLLVLLTNEKGLGPAARRPTELWSTA
jgi:putative drug exporter of the RND superfamily